MTMTAEDAAACWAVWLRSGTADRARWSEALMELRAICADAVTQRLGRPATGAEIAAATRRVAVAHRHDEPLRSVLAAQRAVIAPRWSPREKGKIS